jgi:cyclopropane fatty-acyl-phospholipid synthase-like methyltransferase
MTDGAGASGGQGRILSVLGLLKRKPSATGDKAGGAKAPFKQRFLAWWEGVELTPSDDKPIAKEEAAPEPPPPLIKLEPWETPAIKVAHAIWGEGFNSPGGAAFVLELVKPFAINNSMSILDFGCGAGGGLRAITKEFDVWTTGVERDKATAELGKMLSTRAGLERKAEVQLYDHENFVSRQGGYDCVLSKETLYKFDQREVILARLENNLKTRGQLTIADYLRGDKTSPDDPLLKAAFGNTPPLWTKVEYEKRFTELKFDLRVSEDITDKYRAMALEALDQVTREREGKSVIRTFPEDFLKEVESWGRRIAAMEGGALKVFRFYGIKMGSSSLMSNW